MPYQNQAVATFANTRLDPLRNPQDIREEHVALAANLGSATTPLAAGTLLGELVGVTDVQTLTASAALTAGSYTVGDGTNTTAALAYNATVAQINSALAAATPNPIPYTASGAGPVSGPNPITFTAAYGGVRPALIVTPTGITGGTLSFARTTVGTAGTPGTYRPYNAANTDGSQTPKRLLVYPCWTDSAGNITMGGEFGVTWKTAPTYENGVFKTTDLTGLDQNALTVMGARLTDGTLANGTVRFP